MMLPSATFASLASSTRYSCGGGGVRRGATLAQIHRRLGGLHTRRPCRDPGGHLLLPELLLPGVGLLLLLLLLILRLRLAELLERAPPLSAFEDDVVRVEPSSADARTPNTSP